MSGCTGGAFDSGLGIAVDSAGNAYITGDTLAQDFPTTAGAYRRSYCGGGAYVTKLSVDGSALVYSTFFGCGRIIGASSIAVDAAGNAYIAGRVGIGPGMPILNAFQPTRGGGLSEGFVAKLNAAGSALEYSSFLGGGSSEGVGKIAVDAAGNAYVTGGTRSSDFPTVNPIYPNKRGGTDAFVTKIDASGKSLIYSTYLGGSDGEDGIFSGITVDAGTTAGCWIWI